MLMSTVENARYKFNIVEAVLCTRKVQLTPHKFIEFQQNLEKIPALYPIDRVDVRTHSVAAGLTLFTWDNCYQGQLPNRVFIGMVDNDSLSGVYEKNPFNFKHYLVRKMATFVNGELLPAQLLKLDFESDIFFEGFRSIFTSNGKINRDDTLYLDLTFHYQSATVDIEPIKRGTLKIELELIFQPSTISVIVYADFDNTISVDKFRNVIKDY